MNIIILGGTGYLGSRLIRKLVQTGGHHIICVTRNNGKINNCYSSGQISFCTLSDLQSNLTSFRPDIFINLACCYQKKGISYDEILNANFTVPSSVLHECVSAGVYKIITIGPSLPQDFNMYSFSKHLFEELGRWYSVQEDIQFVNVKLENFYGEDEPEDRFFSGIVGKLLINQDVMLTQGTQKRDFIYVEDVLNALIELMTIATELPYEEIPLGTGDAPTVREVVEYLQKISGSSSRLLFGSLPMRRNEPDTIADGSKMREYGIVVKYSWKEGMKRCLERTKERNALTGRIK